VLDKALVKNGAFFGYGMCGWQEPHAKPAARTPGRQCKRRVYGVVKDLITCYVFFDMGKARRRKRGKDVKGPVPEKKGIQPVRSGRYSSAIVFFIIASTVLLAAYDRNQIWKDEETVWADVTGKSPGKARGYNNLGKAYSDRGFIDKALQEYKKGVRVNPSVARIHYNIGTAYAKQGRTDEAIEKFMVAVSLKPYLKEAHYNLGLAYSKKGMIDEAIEEYKLALRSKPDFIEALNNLGAVYYKQGRMDEAIESLKKVTTLAPRTKKAHYNLGLAYKRKGLKDEAIREFKEVLKLNPQDEKARKILQSLSR
jgi:tetratricopeptide (TPR) repeat protein